MAANRDDPLNYFAQNVIQNHHHDLEVDIPRFPQLAAKAAYSQLDVVSKSVLVSVPSTVPKVGIIGGGIGGLYAAKLLQNLGIPYEILEASPRLGGRLYTERMGDRPNDYYVSIPSLPVTHVLITVT